MSGKVLEEVIKEFDENYPESVSELSIPDETADNINDQHETVFMTEVEGNKENVNVEENVDTEDNMKGTDDIQNNENLDNLKVEDFDHEQFNYDGGNLVRRQISTGNAKQFLYYKSNTETNQSWDNCFENIHAPQDGSGTPCVAEMFTTSNELYTDTITHKNENVKVTERRVNNECSTTDKLFDKKDSDDIVKASERKADADYFSYTDQPIINTIQTEVTAGTTTETDNYEYLKQDGDTIQGHSDHQEVDIKEESQNGLYESNAPKSIFISHTLPDKVNDADLDNKKDVNDKDNTATGNTQNTTHTLSIIAELTKENVTQHAKRFKEESLTKLETILSENSDISPNPKSEIFESKSHSYLKTSNDLDESKCPNIVTTSNASNHTKHIESVEAIQQTTVTLNETNILPAHQQVLSKSSNTKKKKHPKGKRKGKKPKKTLLDHIETLIGNTECSEENFPERKAEQPKPTIQRLKLANEDSGIEKDFEIHGNGEHSNDGRSDHSVNTHPLPVNLHGDKQDVVEVKPLSKRKPKYTKRPVYDALNTSTKLILLNNKYGKHSRLWRSHNFNPHVDRGNLIDPTRHSREPTFYGHFHSRCSTSESPVRFTNTIKPLIQITDRPHSDQIGDRLYETRISKNPNRHRKCTHRQKTDLQPLDFSPPKQRGSSPIYVFAWEKVYSEPPLRPTTSNNRPPSTISGKKIGKEVIKIPEWNSSDVRDKIKQRLTVNKG